MADAVNTIGSAFVKIAPDTSGFSQGLEKGISSAIGGFAPKIVLAFAGVGAAVVGFAVDMGKQFNTSLSAIDARMGITQKQGLAIGTAFLSTAGTVTFSANQIAAAFVPVSGQLDILNHGALTAKQSLDFMSAAMAAAEATGQPLEAVTAALASVMVAYHMPLQDAAAATDILTNASIDLNQPIGDIAGVIDKMHGKLGEATPSLATVAALMVELTQNGVPARLAVTDVSTSITSLIDPSSKGAAAIQDLGLKTLDASGNFVGMDSIIAQLQPKFEPMTKAQQLHTAALIFGKGPAAAMMAIIDAGPKAFDKQTKAVSATGSAVKIAAKTTDDAKGAWDRFIGKVTDIATAAGQNLTGPKGALTGLIKWMTGPGLAGLIAFGGWLGTYIITPFGNIAHAVIPPLLTAIQGIYGWLDKYKLVGPSLTLIVGTFTAWKLLNLAQTILAPLQGVGAIFAIWKAGGLVGVGEALTAALGPIGVAAVAIGLIVAAWEWLAAHEQKTPRVPPGFTEYAPQNGQGGVGISYNQRTSVSAPHALGGFFDKATNIIAGEAGPEVLLNRAQFQAMMGGAPSGGRSVVIHQHFNNNTTQEFREVVASENRKLLTTLRTL